MATFASSAKPKILVVDDQEIIRYSVDSVFTNQGFRVFQASSVAEAAEVLAAQRPDLVILDLSMPGADGMVLLRQMRSGPVFRSTPVIILTAFSDRNFVLEALQLGTRDYVVKAGLAIDDLVARVRLRLEERGVLPPGTVPIGSTSASPKPPAGPALDLAKFLEIIQGKNCGRVLPSIRDQARGLSRSAITSVPEIAEVIRKDPVLTLLVLRSACAAAAARILDLEESIRVLGTDSLQNLLDACAVFEPGLDAETAEDVVRLWAHCDFSSRLLEQIAPDIELAGLVGLLHDLPAVLMASTLSAADWGKVRRRVTESGKPFPEVVSELFGIPYGEFSNAVFANAALPDYLLPVLKEYASVFLDPSPITATRDAWVLETVRQWSGVLLLPGISSINLRIPSKEESGLVAELPDKDAIEALAEKVWRDTVRLSLEFMPSPPSRLPPKDEENPLRIALRREGWAGSDFPLQHLLKLLGEVVAPEKITSGEWDVFVYLGNNPARLWPVGFPYQKPLMIVHRLSEEKCDFPGGKGNLAIRVPCSVARMLQMVGTLGSRVAKPR
jgi:CheY-like chemotaxis protein